MGVASTAPPLPAEPPRKLNPRGSTGGGGAAPAAVGVLPIGATPAVPPPGVEARVFTLSTSESSVAVVALRAMAVREPPRDDGRTPLLPAAAAAAAAAAAPAAPPPGVAGGSAGLPLPATPADEKDDARRGPVLAGSNAAPLPPAAASAAAPAAPLPAPPRNTLLVLITLRKLPPPLPPPPTRLATRPSSPPASSRGRWPPPAMPGSPGSVADAAGAAADAADAAALPPSRLTTPSAPPPGAAGVLPRDRVPPAFSAGRHTFTWRSNSYPILEVNAVPAAATPAAPGGGGGATAPSRHTRSNPPTAVSSPVSRPSMSTMSSVSFSSLYLRS